MLECFFSYKEQIVFCITLKIKLVRDALRSFTYI